MFKKTLCALLLCALLMPAALAATITEATLVYEDEDSIQVQQTLTDPALLSELETILAAAHKNPVDLNGEHTMNCTLMCVTAEDIFDFACATDGSAFITDNATETTYAVDADDMDRLWEMFSEVKTGMGIEAADAFEDWDDAEDWGEDETEEDLDDWDEEADPFEDFDELES